MHFIIMLLIVIFPKIVTLKIFQLISSSVSEIFLAFKKLNVRANSVTESHSIVFPELKRIS